MIIGLRSTKMNEHSQWLENRKKALAVVTLLVSSANPYKSNVELWEEKTGRRVAEDISAKECVEYGKSQRNI